MNLDWKIAIVIAVAFLVGIYLITWLQANTLQQYAYESYNVPMAEQGGTQVESLPAATGNPDDAVNAILDGSANEQPILDAEAADVSPLTADIQAIGDFGQSYDENTF